MRERSNRADSKSVEPRKWFRGFESHSLRQLRGRVRLRVLSPSRPSAATGSRRDDRAAEGARLESVCTLTGTVGSNPTLSASMTGCALLTGVGTALRGATEPRQDRKVATVGGALGSRINPGVTRGALFLS